MKLETLLDWQERGSNARILGLPAADHPLLQNGEQPATADEDWQLKYDAWLFGWHMEDSVRRIDTGVNRSLRRSTG